MSKAAKETLEVLGDCLHCRSSDFVSGVEVFEEVELKNPTTKNNNMICLKCKFVGLNITDFDSKKHAETENHPIALRLQTCEYWCFPCKKVVVSKNLKHHKKLVNQVFWAETM